MDKKATSLLKTRCYIDGQWVGEPSLAVTNKASGEVYGRGLGEAVLADVKMLNRMDRTTIRAAEKMADPPLLAPPELAPPDVAREGIIPLPSSFEIFP